MPSLVEKIEIENFTSPGRVYRVDRRKYEAMRDALLAGLPPAAPRLTIVEARQAVTPPAAGSVPQW